MAATVLWEDLCRLCSTDKKCDVDLFVNKNSSDHLQKAIEKYFSIALNPKDTHTDMSSRKICNDCNRFVKKIQNFDDHVKKVNMMFTELAKSNKYFIEEKGLVEIRKKYGVQDGYFDEEGTFIEINDSKTERVINENRDCEENTEGEIKSEPSSYEYEMAEEIEEYETIPVETILGSNIEEIIEKEADFDKQGALHLEENTIISNKLNPVKLEDESESDDDFTENEGDIECIEIENDENKTKSASNGDDIKGNEKNFCCKQCNKTYAQKRYHRQHMQRVHGVKYICKTCGRKYTTEKGLKQHGLSPCSKENDFFCDQCNKKYTGKKYFKEHMKKHEHDANYECPVYIGNNEKEKKPTKITKGKEDNRTDFFCEQCNKTYTQEIYYRRHIRLIHSSNYRYRCKICKKKYATENGLKRHEESHKDLQKFTCKICSKTFSSAANCKIHEDIHLPRDKKKLHQCLHCGKKVLNLKTHVLAFHSGERERMFVCEVCGKRFITKRQLAEHRQIHVDEPSYNCMHCSKKFKSFCYLQLHIQTHSEKKFVCSHCGSKFKTRRSLRSHMIKHSNVKKYKCEYCGREFKRSRALQIHLVHHTGLRPFMCKYCDKSFVYDCSLRAHMKRLHPAEFAELELTGKTISSYKNLPKLEQLKAVISSKSAENALIEVPQKKQRNVEVTSTKFD